VNAVMNLRVPYNTGKLSSGCRTGGLSSSTQLELVFMFQILKWRQKLDPPSPSPLIVR
jgi:hypothetical protein